MTWSKTFGPVGPDEAQRHALLARDGCSLDVIIRADATSIAVAGAVTKTEHRTSALIDTGASKVCIDYRIAQELDLRQIDQTTLLVVGGKIEAPIYLGLLEIPGLEYREMIELVAPKIGQLRCEVLLGRSLLSAFIMTFDGPGGQVHFSRRVPDYLQPYDYG